MAAETWRRAAFSEIEGPTVRELQGYADQCVPGAGGLCKAPSDPHKGVLGMALLIKKRNLLGIMVLGMQGEGCSDLLTSSITWQETGSPCLRLWLFSHSHQCSVMGGGSSTLWAPLMITCQKFHLEHCSLIKVYLLKSTDRYL